jgi:hypothetical protein
MQSSGSVIVENENHLATSRRKQHLVPLPDEMVAVASNASQL